MMYGSPVQVSMGLSHLDAERSATDNVTMKTELINCFQGTACWMCKASEGNCPRHPSDDEMPTEEYKYRPDNRSKKNRMKAPKIRRTSDE